MDLSHANFIKWVGLGQFPIKIEGQLLMTGVWMSFLPKVEMNKNKNPSSVSSCREVAFGSKDF